MTMYEGAFHHPALNLSNHNGNHQGMKPEVIEIPHSPNSQQSTSPHHDYYDDSPDDKHEPSETYAQSEYEPEPKIEDIPESNPSNCSSNSVQERFLDRLELKTNSILDNYKAIKDDWTRCETLGNRVAQTMFFLEQNDKDLALKFDIIISEAITNIKKEKLQRLMNQSQASRLLE